MLYNRVLSDEDSQRVWGYVAPLLTADRYHARAIVQSHDSTEQGHTEQGHTEQTHIEQWHIEVDRVNGEWFAISEAGHVHEYRGGATYHRGEVVQRPTAMTDELVAPLQLAFPGEMLTWGQSSGSFRPILVEKIGKRSLLITFEHRLDPSMRNTLVIDTDAGVVTRYLPFNSPYIVLLDVELERGVERIHRTSFPDLEVLTPDY